MPDDPSLPASKRLVVIGTPETIRTAAAVLREAGDSPVGAILVSKGASAERPALPLPVLGTIGELDRLHATSPFAAALVSIPVAMRGVIGSIRESLQRLGIEERFLPASSDVLRLEPGALWAGIAGRFGAGGGRESIDLSALVGRPARRIDEVMARGAVEGKRVLITGAGGSIGSELARLCARFEPSLLVVMDRSDNALFEIDREIGGDYPELPRRAVLHDVVDADATLRRLVALRPDVVFHAAAHKHVPLMEDHPAAAVNNNLFGTKSVADAALAVGVERFVMISTDKAVNPSSVMGATKRLAEVYVRSLNGQGRTHFSLVRFGNVLGSACSVLPIWAKQIAAGGPITVTHPDMTRYFMTIPEAAALVIQAASINRTERHGDEVFVLDMGEPVQILELARRFVRLHGLEPAVENSDQPDGGVGRVPTMRITFTGIRPGEKLHEELTYQAEELQSTRVEGVMAWSGEAPDRSGVASMVADLSGVRHNQSPGAVLEVLGRYVPQISQNTQNSNLPTVTVGAA